jgi:hypothetical protein
VGGWDWFGTMSDIRRSEPTVDWLNLVLPLPLPLPLPGRCVGSWGDWLWVSWGAVGQGVVLAWLPWVLAAEGISG